MDILWSSAGICAIVFILFFALARHWQKVLQQQSLTIRRLSDRLRDLQEVIDPEFRRRLSESSPMPLDQVFHFTFRFSDRFWRHALQIGPADWDFVKQFGTFVGSVKLEKWRSHTEATVTEVLPEGSAARWQTRTIEFYPDAGNRQAETTLWELRLAPTNGTAERAPTLELFLCSHSLELRAKGTSRNFAAGNGHKKTWPQEDDDGLILRVPFDPELLAKFRGHDPAEALNGSHAEEGGRLHGSGWRAYYAYADEVLGIDWELRLRDLNKKAQWDRWKILESPVIPYSTSRRS
jgi:hypothetical protein